RSHGAELELHPILRLRYSTWDALEVALTHLALPEHLAAAFGRGEIAAAQFAAEWRTRVSEQAGLLEEVKTIRSPRVLLRFLAGKTDGPWEALSAEYHALK